MASLVSYALCTVADVKESLGIASSDTSWDNIITRKINQATQMIESYCGRRFLQTTYTDEEYDSTRSNQLILRQRPIVGSITLGRRNGTLNDDNWNDIDTDLYFADANSGVIDLLFTTSGIWNGYRVTYTAGYATIPADIAEACATLAAYYTLNADGVVGVREKQEGARKIMYYEGIKSFDGLINVLGIDVIINSYSNSPVLTDR